MYGTGSGPSRGPLTREPCPADRDTRSSHMPYKSAFLFWRLRVVLDRLRSLSRILGIHMRALKIITIARRRPNYSLLKDLIFSLTPLGDNIHKGRLTASSPPRPRAGAPARPLSDRRSVPPHRPPCFARCLAKSYMGSSTWSRSWRCQCPDCAGTPCVARA